MHTKLVIVFATLVLTLTVHGQTPQTAQKPDEPIDTRMFYENGWEVGENKHCVTLWDGDGLLICNSKGVDKYIHCSADFTGDPCRKAAIRDVRLDSKHFDIKFSEKPWPRQDRNGWWYKCRKGEVVTCTKEDVPK